MASRLVVALRRDAVWHRRWICSHHQGRAARSELNLAWHYGSAVQHTDPQREDAVFIRLTRAQLDPAKYESTASLRGELANIVRALPGCQGYQIAGN
jgi:hypothetical protein